MSKKRSSLFHSFNSDKLNFYLIIIFQFISLLFLYILKYQKHGLSFSDFSITKTGNLFNLLFFLIFLTGFILLLIKRNNLFTKRTGNFYIISLLQIIFLFASFISLKFNLITNEIYFLDQPIQKVLTGLLFSIFQFFQVFLICIIWLLVFEREQFIYLRALFNSVLSLILLISLSFYYSSLKSTDISYYKNKNTYEIGVVLGAAVWTGNIPSPSLAARSDKAVELYKEGIINKILFTGSNAPGEKPESIVANEYIQKDSIPSKNILIEAKTTSTVEQIQYIKNELLDFSEKTDILVISDGFHLRRVDEIAKFYNLNIKVASSELKSSWESKLYNRFRESIALLFFWLYAI